MRLRAPEDGSVPQIDMTENGILLDPGVHKRLGKGEVAFIKV
jgi:HNH endonuclease